MLEWQKQVFPLALLAARIECCHHPVIGSAFQIELIRTALQLATIRTELVGKRVHGE